jgi:hypothetical protein
LHWPLHGWPRVARCRCGWLLASLLLRRRRGGSETNRRRSDERSGHGHRSVRRSGLAAHALLRLPLRQSVRPNATGRTGRAIRVSTHCVAVAARAAAVDASCARRCGRQRLWLGWPSDRPWRRRARWACVQQL